MNYGNIKFFATEDGVGVRTVLFVSGCRNHCPDCFQKETWDFAYGREFDEEAQHQIMESLLPSYIAGLTLCGGEPFEPENQRALVPFLERVRTLYPNKTVWSYSGYTFEQLTDPGHPAHTETTMDMLGMLDVLVDGRFKQELASPLLPYRGSANQRVIDVPETLRLGRVVLSPYGERHGRTTMQEDRNGMSVPYAAGTNADSVTDGLAVNGVSRTPHEGQVSPAEPKGPADVPVPGDGTGSEREKPSLD